MKKIITLSSVLLALFALTQLATAGVQCLTPGKYQAIRYDWGPNQKNVRKITVRVGSDWGGNYRCMGRCGVSCWGSPGSWSRIYTKDCLTHDVCSRERNSKNGAKDANCGDEYDDAIDDTALALVNGCRYGRGLHMKAARGEFR